MDNMRDILDQDRAGLVRAYAAGDLSWRELHDRGFETYLDVLAGLGELGLRQPVAPLEGPSAAARTLGRGVIRDALRSRQGR